MGENHRIPFADRVYLEEILGNKTTQSDQIVWTMDALCQALQHASPAAISWLLMRQKMLPIYRVWNRKLSIAPEVELHQVTFVRSTLTFRGETTFEGCAFRDCTLRFESDMFDIIDFQRCTFDEVHMSGSGVLRMEHSIAGGLKLEKWKGGVQIARTSLARSEWDEVQLFGDNDFILHSDLSHFYCRLWQQSGEGHLRSCDLSNARFAETRGMLRHVDCILHNTKLVGIQPGLVKGYPALVPAPFSAPASTSRSE